jgi:heat shock protein HslJ
MTPGRDAFLCAAALLLAACASGHAPDPAPAAPVPPVTFTGTRWLGVVEEPADPRSTPRIEFTAQDRMSGYTGCNIFSGDWSMEGATVRIGKMAMSKRLCLGPAREIEKRFVAAMREGSRGTRTGDKLVFVAPDGERFEFREAAAG